MASGRRLVLPMAVLNMGGEMVNILHQRLDAQKVDNEKGNLVLQDVIRTMYSAKFIDELFKPQDMYSEKATRQIFHKLAHSSIMRLNESSMGKLYDLITMGFKYQVVSCAQPQQLLQVTLNHLEVLKTMVPLPSTINLIDTVIETTVTEYAHLDVYGWIQLKQSLMEFLQGQRVKVSLFLQHNVQLQDGTLVLNANGKLPFGVDMPGTIRYMKHEDGERIDDKVMTLPMASTESVCGALESYIDLDSSMGTNLYTLSPNGALDPGTRGIRSPATEAAAKVLMEAATRKPVTGRRKVDARAEAESKGEGRKAATAGLNLLASLLGGSAKDIGYDGYSDEGGDNKGSKGGGGVERTQSNRVPFKFNLFSDEDPLLDGAQAKETEESRTIVLDLASDHTGCAKMLRDLDLADDADGGVNDGRHGVRSERKGIDGGEAKPGEGEVGQRDSSDDLLDLMDAAELK